MQQQDTHRQQQIDFATLRQMVSIEQVLELVNFRATERKGDQIRGLCPIHGSENPKSRSFSVNTARNAFQCFGCGEKGNQLDLAAACFELPLYRASLTLCEQLGIEPFRKL